MFVEKRIMEEAVIEDLSHRHRHKEQQQSDRRRKEQIWNVTIHRQLSIKDVTEAKGFSALKLYTSGGMIFRSAVVKSNYDEMILRSQK